GSITNFTFAASASTRSSRIALSVKARNDLVGQRLRHGNPGQSGVAQGLRPGAYQKPPSFVIQGCGFPNQPDVIRATIPINRLSSGQN
ncbi:MAG: hypothetical protein JO141_14865, partial [Bradyrhizobium sp.]|nr:hypothetical protein [Bradyrhizobium sp.]